MKYSELTKLQLWAVRLFIETKKIWLPRTELLCRIPLGDAEGVCDALTSNDAIKSLEETRIIKVSDDMKSPDAPKRSHYELGEYGKFLKECIDSGRLTIDE